MATDVLMPQMGESIAEGTITKWLKKVGDPVERDEPLYEISTDKVDAEIPSPVAGILREIRVPPGTTVPVNTVVGLIAEEGAELALAIAAQGKSATAEESADLLFHMLVGLRAKGVPTGETKVPPRRDYGARRRLPV